MITITPGIVPALERAHWWHGREARCPLCKARLKLEPKDAESGAVVTNAERHPGGRQWVEIYCPTQGCTSRFTLEKTPPPFGEKPT